MSNVSLETQYWILVGLMIGVVLLHFSMYPIAIWRYIMNRQIDSNNHYNNNNNNNSAVPRKQSFCRKLCGCMFLSLFPAVIFGLFAYMFPATILMVANYCAGDTSSTHPDNCDEAANAGGAPFVFVFGATCFMWIFDLIGSFYNFQGLQVYLENVDENNNNNSGSIGNNVHLTTNEDCNGFCTAAPKLLLPRFGLTMMYAMLVCFAGSIQVQIKLKEKNDNVPDLDAQLDYMKRLRRAGYIAMAIMLLLWSVALYYHRPVKQSSRNQYDVNEREEELEEGIVLAIQESNMMINEKYDKNKEKEDTSVETATHTTYSTV